MTAARDEVQEDPEKRNPPDFALWFKAVGRFENHIMRWDSPWGVGFPGWHVECSAMSMKYLGETLDIHTGGEDHIWVHHPNEIAQSEGATGKKFVRYWMHGAFLVVGSSPGQQPMRPRWANPGNFLRLQTLIDKGYDPLAYRYHVLLRALPREAEVHVGGVGLGGRRGIRTSRTSSRARSRSAARSSPG